MVMTMTDPLEELPPRAQIGAVLKEYDGTELDPSTVVGILVGKGVTVHDASEMRELAADVMRHRGLISGTGDK